MQAGTAIMLFYSPTTLQLFKMCLSIWPNHEQHSSQLPSLILRGRVTLCFTKARSIEIFWLSKPLILVIAFSKLSTLFSSPTRYRQPEIMPVASTSTSGEKTQDGWVSFHPRLWPIDYFLRLSVRITECTSTSVAASSISQNDWRSIIQRVIARQTIVQVEQKTMVITAQKSKDNSLKVNVDESIRAPET